MYDKRTCIDRFSYLLAIYLCNVTRGRMIITNIFQVGKTRYLHNHSTDIFYNIMSRDSVVCATRKGSDQPARTRSLLRAFASRLNIL